MAVMSALVRGAACPGTLEQAAAYGKNVVTKAFDECCRNLAAKAEKKPSAELI